MFAFWGIWIHGATRNTLSDFHTFGFSFATLGWSSQAVGPPGDQNLRNQANLIKTDQNLIKTLENLINLINLMLPPRPP